MHIDSSENRHEPQSIADLLERGLGSLQSANPYVAEAFHAIDDALISIAERSQLPPHYCFLKPEQERQIVGILGAFHDLTKRVRMQELGYGNRIQEAADEIIRKLSQVLSPEDGGK